MGFFSNKWIRHFINTATYIDVSYILVLGYKESACLHWMVFFIFSTIGLNFYEKTLKECCTNIFQYDQALHSLSIRLSNYRTPLWQVNCNIYVLKKYNFLFDDSKVWVYTCIPTILIEVAHLIKVKTFFCHETNIFLLHIKPFQICLRSKKFSCHAQHLQEFIYPTYYMIEEKDELTDVNHRLIKLQG